MSKRMEAIKKGLAKDNYTKDEVTELIDEGIATILEAIIIKLDQTTKSIKKI